jgi:hypothetical protein
VFDSPDDRNLYFSILHRFTETFVISIKKYFPKEGYAMKKHFLTIMKVGLIVFVMISFGASVVPAAEEMKPKKEGEMMMKAKGESMAEEAGPMKQEGEKMMEEAPMKKEGEKMMEEAPMKQEGKMMMKEDTTMKKEKEMKE